MAAGRVVNLIRFNGASAANTAKTVSTTDAFAATAKRSGIGDSSNTQQARLRFLYATVTYNSTPTYTAANLYASINSGISSFYDTRILTGSSANAQHVLLQPTTDIFIDPDEVVDVVAPAGGAGVISYITIVCERVA